MVEVILSYETLDKLADAFIPLLAIIFLLATVIIFFRSPDDRKALGKTFIYGVFLIVISYGLMFLDKRFHLWHSAGLDYSTHTAVSLALIIPLCLLLKRYQTVFIISALAYTALMLYQKYHSMMDIVTTAAVISLCALLIHKWLFSK